MVSSGRNGKFNLPFLISSITNGLNLLSRFLKQKTLSFHRMTETSWKEINLLCFKTPPLLGDNKYSM